MWHTCWRQDAVLVPVSDLAMHSGSAYPSEVIMSGRPVCYTQCLAHRRGDTGTHRDGGLHHNTKRPGRGPGRHVQCILILLRERKDARRRTMSAPEQHISVLQAEMRRLEAFLGTLSHEDWQ